MAGVVLAIDPGPVRSAWIVYNPETRGIRSFAITSNDELLPSLRRVSSDVEAVVIEKIESFGMAVGWEVFETVYWSGRFAEAVDPVPVFRVGRKAVKSNLCGDQRAKDANIRAALIDRFGGTSAIGTTKQRGPLYGVSKDVWAALAVAVTFADSRRVAA